MGLLGAMFGGGTDLQIVLDNPTAAAGSVVGGTVTLIGGQKPLKLSELTVRAIFVSTTTREGSSLPDVDIKEIGKQVVAANGAIPPGSQQRFTFRITIPHDMKPTAFTTSYQVVAVADIPGVKDPSAKADLKIVDADNEEHRRLPLQEIEQRFTGLRSQNEEQVVDALHELDLACYSEAAALVEVEPLLVWYVQNGSIEIKRGALRTWAHLVDNRVQPQHLQFLFALAQTPGLDDGIFEQVIVAACRFAEEGALGLVQQLAQHPDPTARERVASNLRFNAAEKFQGKRELVFALVQDRDERVRKSAVGTLSQFCDDRQVVMWLGQILEQDLSPEVQAEALSSIAFAAYNGMNDLVLQVYERHAQNPNVEVRREIARRLSRQKPAAIARVWAIAQRLAADTDEDVRAALAFEFNNMQELPQMLALAQHMVQHDPSDRVRRETLGAMASMMKPHEVAQYFGVLMAQARGEDDLWPVLSAFRHHREDRAIKPLLTQLGQCPYPSIANSARDALSN
jgi:hypothetical protein